VPTGALSVRGASRKRHSESHDAFAVSSEFTTRDFACQVYRPKIRRIDKNNPPKATCQRNVLQMTGLEITSF
jgi:hypothetical protein